MQFMFPALCSKAMTVAHQHQQLATTVLCVIGAQQLPQQHLMQPHEQARRYFTVPNN